MHFLPSGKASLATFQAKIIHSLATSASSRVEFIPRETIGLAGRSCDHGKYWTWRFRKTQFPQEPRPQRIKCGSDGGLIGIDPPLEHNKDSIAGIRVATNQVTVPTQRRRPYDKDPARARTGCYCGLSLLRLLQHRDAEMLPNQELGNSNLNATICHRPVTSRASNHLPAQSER